MYLILNSLLTFFFCIDPSHVFENENEEFVPSFRRMQTTRWGYTPTHVLYLSVPSFCPQQQSREIARRKLICHSIIFPFNGLVQVCTYQCMVRTSCQCVHMRVRYLCQSVNSILCFQLGLYFSYSCETCCPESKL